MFELVPVALGVGAMVIALLSGVGLLITGHFAKSTVCKKLGVLCLAGAVVIFLGVWSFCRMVDRDKQNPGSGPLPRVEASAGLAR